MTKLTTLALAAALCTAAGIACADSGDSSMNPFTGDSWAALQGGGHNLGLGQPRGTVTIAAAPKAAAPDRPAGTVTVARARRPIDFGHHAPVVDANDAS